MKNTYLTSYFPLISIIFYSFSLAIFFETNVIEKLKQMGIYQGMLEFSSDRAINLAVLFLFCFLFFMLFSALKLIADTMIELSLLFFSKDREGTNLNQIRRGSIIYLVSGVVSLFFVQNLISLIVLFMITTTVYFIFFIYKISSSLSPAGLVNIIFFHVIFWSALILIIVYLCFKLYNSVISSLPI